MLKFEFHYPDTEIITHQLLGNHHTLTEVIEAFEQFLLGAGYSFPKGASLGYEYEDSDEEEELERTIPVVGDARVHTWISTKELAEMTKHTCPRDSSCHGIELGTCDVCSYYTKPGNCT